MKRTNDGKQKSTISNTALQLRIELDANEIYPNDPGQGTPAMVILMDENCRRELDSGTFNCAIGEGELSHNGTQLTEAQREWLYSQKTAVDEFITRHSPAAA